MLPVIYIRDKGINKPSEVILGGLYKAKSDLLFYKLKSSISLFKGPLSIELITNLL